MKNTDQSKTPALPDWVVVQLAHDSTFIPAAVRDQFLLSDADLSEEVCRMAHYLKESMAVVGMSAIYCFTSSLQALRLYLKAAEKLALMAQC